MDFVYVIYFKTTGQNWQTTICKSSKGAATILFAYNMLREYGDDDSEIQDYRNPKDPSQTATVVKKILFT